MRIEPFKQQEIKAGLEKRNRTIAVVFVALLEIGLFIKILFF